MHYKCITFLKLYILLHIFVPVHLLMSFRNLSLIFISENAFATACFSLYLFVFVRFYLAFPLNFLLLFFLLALLETLIKSIMLEVEKLCTAGKKVYIFALSRNFQNYCRKGHMLLGRFYSTRFVLELKLEIYKRERERIILHSGQMWITIEVIQHNYSAKSSFHMRKFFVNNMLRFL